MRRLLNNKIYNSFADINGNSAYRFTIVQLEYRIEVKGLKMNNGKREIMFGCDKVRWKRKACARNQLVIITLMHN